MSKGWVIAVFCDASQFSEFRLTTCDALRSIFALVRFKICLWLTRSVILMLVTFWDQELKNVTDIIEAKFSIIPSIAFSSSGEISSTCSISGSIIPFEIISGSSSSNLNPWASSCSESEVWRLLIFCCPRVKGKSKWLRFSQIKNDSIFRFRKRVRFYDCGETFKDHMWCALYDKMIVCMFTSVSPSTKIFLLYFIR